MKSYIIQNTMMIHELHNQSQDDKTWQVKLTGLKPKDLVREVAPARLDGVARLLGDALHDDDDLELQAEQRLRRHLEERALLVDLRWPK